MSQHEPSLPFSGIEPLARHHSWLSAQHAARTRGEKSLRYLQALTEAGEWGLTDWEAASLLGWPLSSVCSIRNGARGCVRPAAERGLSPFGRWITRWRRC